MSDRFLLLIIGRGLLAHIITYGDEDLSAEIGLHIMALKQMATCWETARKFENMLEVVVHEQELEKLGNAQNTSQLSVATDGSSHQCHSTFDIRNPAYDYDTVLETHRASNQTSNPDKP
ncbi:hypothetical protein POJ06DRAFT_276968 [Lipomyces tetrasporus]|uniref:Uncharacterized protein n=1 Tax=Lipomyces tetrasporus TaxID=54092 RepID=A0AAD7VRV3_9ASCO|nr:uncharacterized protein POJ06DRAFT_276968 [Lipomyces tetrasporus]KAJ8098515.1 hypothetical protein POJ06DRAFT_276968 [Lipomyces tetrasporus]